MAHRLPTILVFKYQLNLKLLNHLMFIIILSP